MEHTVELTQFTQLMGQLLQVDPTEYIPFAQLIQFNTKLEFMAQVSQKGIVFIHLMHV